MAPVTVSTGSVVNAGIKPPLGCGTARREAACAGRTLPVARILRLKAPVISGKLVLPRRVSRFAGAYADPPLRRVLLFRVLVSRPRANGAVRAADSARGVSLAQYFLPCNRQG